MIKPLLALITDAWLGNKRKEEKESDVCMMQVNI